MDVIYSLNEINKTAKEFLNNNPKKKVIAFNAPMGAGKTTFIHALCEVLGVQSNISSPTFSIINQYHSIKGNIIYHMDLYRLKNEEEAINAGIEDALFSGNLCLVEWPEKASGLLPDDTLYVSIEIEGDGVRKLKY